MPSKQLEEKGIPDKNLIYLACVLVILGLLVLIIILTFFWRVSLINDLKKRLVNYQISEVKRASESIEKVITRELEDIENLAFQVAILNQKKEDVETLISRFMNENIAIREVSLINLSGREESRFSKKEIFSQKLGRDFAFLEEFETAKNGILYISRVNFDENAEPYLIIDVPIRRTEVEKPSGVLRAIFYLQAAWAEVLETHIGRTGRISVVDDKGMLIADPSPARVLKKINLLDFPPVKAVTRGEFFLGGEYFNEKMTKVIGVGAPIKRLKWGAIIEQDLEEFQEPLKPINEMIVVIFFGTFLICGIVIWLLNTIVKADKELWRRYTDWEKAQQEIFDAKQILEIKVRARTKELEELAKSLEVRVDERTKELKEKVEELERFHKLTVGRELKMIELKNTIKELQKKLEELKKNK